MRRPLINLITVFIALEAGTAKGIHEIEIPIPDRLDTIVGMVLFEEVKPAGMTDYTVQVNSDDVTFLPRASKRLYESGNSVAPNEKFFTDFEVPCGTGKTVKALVRIDEAIPAEQELKASIVVQVINKKEYQLEAQRIKAEGQIQFAQ